MAYGITISNPSTGLVTLSDTSYTLGFKGKAGLSYSVASFPFYADPPWGNLLNYDIVGTSEIVPVCFLTTTPGVYCCVVGTFWTGSVWRISVLTSSRAFTPEVYCFTRLLPSDIVRGGFGLMVFDGSGIPAFSSNSKMLNPVATVSVSVPGGNQVDYFNGNPGVRISTQSTTTGLTNYSGATKPAIMFQSTGRCITVGNAPSWVIQYHAASLMGNAIVISWAASHYSSTNNTFQPANTQPQVVSVIDASIYD